MRLGLCSEGACCFSGRYQLLFQGEILSRKESFDAGKPGLENWNPLQDVMEKIRPGKFAVLSQDLDFEIAKRQMRKFRSLGIVTYIEPMGNALTFSRTFI